MLPIAAALLVGCSSGTDVWAHQGDTMYARNYISDPPAPRIDSVVPGDQSIRVYFTPMGGNSFTAVCSSPSNGTYGNSVSSYKSPVLVDKLINKIEYRCAVWAFNPYPSAASAYLYATPNAP